MGKGYKGRNPKGKSGKEVDEQAEREFMESRRGNAGQNANAGMLPPNSSDEDDDAPAPSRPVGQNANAGMLPPNSSDEEDSSSDEENEYLSAPRRKPPPEPAKSAEEVAADMERLALIRKKREDDRKKRIETEGWDRFAPLSETNHPPGQTRAS